MNKAKNELDKLIESEVDNTVELGKEYVLTSNSGSIYRNQNSIGYFLKGSRLTFLEPIRDDFGDGYLVSIKGKTFSVTQDASFGNNSSKSTTYDQETKGVIYKDHIGTHRISFELATEEE